MRNILAHVPQKEKGAFAAQLKEIWLAPTVELARQLAGLLSERYAKRLLRAIEILERDWRIHWRSMRFRNSTPTKSPPPTCWGSGTKKSAAGPALLKFFPTRIPISDW
jgi:hypothetical protein